MKLNELILKIKEKIDYAKDKDIIEVVNSLENKIQKHVLTPAGIKPNQEISNEKFDTNRELLLSGEYSELYFYYVMAIISAKEQDTKAYENYMKLFNSEYLDFAVHFRRNNCPVNRAVIGGRNI